jgi:hypothetical protein
MRTMRQSLTVAFLVPLALKQTQLRKRRTWFTGKILRLLVGGIILFLCLPRLALTQAAPGPGDLDTTFNSAWPFPGTIIGGNGTATAVAIQTDGKIVVAGEATESTPNGIVNEFGVVRYRYFRYQHRKQRHHHKRPPGRAIRLPTGPMAARPA